MSRPLNTANQTSVQSIGLALGAGREQLAAIKEAKAQGLRVLAVDANPDAPGFQFADIAYTVDLKHVDAVISIARRHNVEFTLPTPIGHILTTQAAVHEALDLKGVKPQSALMCTDKHLFHERMSEVGVHVPSQKLISSKSTLLSLQSSSLRFPLVIKPRTGSGSRGVRVVASPMDWPTAVKALIDQPLFDEWLIEPFIDGPVLGIDGAVTNGLTQILLTREKTLTPWPNRVELTYRAPATLREKENIAIYNLISSALSALQINNSLFHADIILESGRNPTLIELSARPSGLRIASELVPICTGVNILKQGISLHRFGLGDFNPLMTRPSLLYYFHHSKGVVQAAPKIESLLELPFVFSADVGWSYGQRVTWPSNVGELLSAGHILISAPSWDLVEATLHKALSKFKVHPDEFTQ